MQGGDPNRPQRRTKAVSDGGSFGGALTQKGRGGARALPPARGSAHEALAGLHVRQAAHRTVAPETSARRRARRPAGGLAAQQCGPCTLPGRAPSSRRGPLHSSAAPPAPPAAAVREWCGARRPTSARPAPPHRLPFAGPPGVHHHQRGAGELLPHALGAGLPAPGVRARLAPRRDQCVWPRRRCSYWHRAPRHAASRQPLRPRLWTSQRRALPEERAPHASAPRACAAGQMQPGTPARRAHALTAAPPPAQIPARSVGLTILKRVCRRFGIPRWPYNRQGRPHVRACGAGPRRRPERACMPHRRRSARPATHSAHTPLSLPAATIADG